MEIKYFEQKAFMSRGTRPIPPPGWKCGGDGGLVAEHFTSPQHKAGAKAVHATTRDVIGESYFERCVLASMLAEITSETLVFMELGAGWGAQSLGVTQMVRNRMAPQTVDTWCFAVEAEPIHHGFVCETFRVNHVPGTIVFGATAETLGWAQFYSVEDPAHNYGQSIHARGNLRVPVYTVDYLMETFKIPHVDIIHMDVQRHEVQTLMGARDSMRAGLIDYMLVCPHHGIDEFKIVELVKPYFDIVISIRARAGYLDIPGFPKQVYHPQDGIIVCKRKGI